MHQQKENIVVLIPAFNAAETLPELLRQLRSIVSPKQVVVVDDGSTDQTANIAEKEDAVVLVHEQNTGKGAALKSGFREFLQHNYADYVLCMDADLQHRIEDIPKFLAIVHGDKCDMVVGNRVNRIENMPLHRRLSNRITSVILSTLTRQKIKDSQCGFRLIHRDVLESVRLRENGFQLESEMILAAAEQGFQIKFVDIPTIYQNESSAIRNVYDTLKFIALIIRHVKKTQR